MARGAFDSVAPLSCVPALRARGTSGEGSLEGLLATGWKQAACSCNGLNLVTLVSKTHVMCWVREVDAQAWERTEREVCMACINRAKGKTRGIRPMAR